VTVQNRIFFTYLYLDNTTGMTHLKNILVVTPEGKKKVLRQRRIWQY